MYSLTSSHIFSKENYDYTKITSTKPLKPTYGAEDRMRLCRKIFMDFLELLINHLIDTGDKFRMPTENESYIYIEKKPEWETKQIMQNGAYGDLDLFECDFTLYHPVLTFMKGRKKFVKPIAITKKTYRKLYNKTCEGKRYFG